MKANGLSLLMGILMIVSFLVGIFAGSRSTIRDVDRHVRVVYDESNGVRVLFDGSVQAAKAPCYDGDPVGRCYLISCKPPVGEAAPPKASEEPAATQGE